MEFSDKEIICDTKNSHSVYDWSMIKELAMGKNAMYLYVDANMVILIPKRVFQSEDERIGFEKLIISKINKTM